MIHDAAGKWSLRVQGLDSDPGRYPTETIGKLIKPDDEFTSPKVEFALGTRGELDGDKIYDTIVSELDLPFSLKESHNKTNCALFCFRLFALLSPTPTKRSVKFCSTKEHYTFHFSAAAVFIPALPCGLILDDVEMDSTTGFHSWAVHRERLKKMNNIAVADVDDEIDDEANVDAHEDNAISANLVTTTLPETE